MLTVSLNSATSLRRTLLLAGSLLALLAAAPAARAQAGEGDEEVDEVVVTGRFIATGAFSGTKLDISVADTPLSVAAYTRSFMDAVEVTQIADLYKYMTGVQRGGNTGYDISLRGFKTAASDRNAILTDGLPGLSVRFGSPPTIGTDHVEVVKGPASVLYGQAQPGGFVNIIAKKPSHDRQLAVEGRFGAGLASYHRPGIAIVDLDATGPIGDSGWAYRLIGEAGETKGFRDFSYEHPVYVAPSVSWDIGERTRATLLLEYRRTKTHYDSYLVAPQKDVRLIRDISTTYQEPGDYQTERGTTATLFFSHEFTPALKLNLGYRWVDHEDAARGWDVVGITANRQQVTRRARGQANTRIYNFVDANLVADFGVGPIRNKLVFGASAGREISDFNRLQFFNAPATGPLSANIDIFNPAYGRVLPLSAYPLVNPNTPANLNHRYSVSDARGVYVSDFITFSEKLKALVGLRWAKEELSIDERRLAGVPKQAASNHDWLPMAGIVFQPTEQWSLYASYSTSFVPVPPSNQDINGRYSFSPTTASSIEGGVKADLLDHRLTFTVAVFDIRKKNVINTFTCPLGTCAEQVGEERSRGVELEANAQPLPNWQIAAGYSHLDAKVTESNVANQVGAWLTNAPEHNAHLWTRYDIQGGALEGLGLGLGVAYSSERAGLMPTRTSTATLPLPAYTTVDVALYYAVRDINFTLKVSNIFDERYYESAGGQGDLAVFPGEPRAISLTVRTRF
ncbi:TonB-dependent receptor [Phenylobacterium sp.]|uniref:TonB-dependent siderophore receptor n=1 Tax=Phenylobacterium sp. TaxID=1871053 RepID=UPI002ED7B264